MSLILYFPWECNQAGKFCDRSDLSESYERSPILLIQKYCFFHFYHWIRLIKYLYIFLHIKWTTCWHSSTKSAIYFIILFKWVQLHATSLHKLSFIINQFQSVCMFVCNQFLVIFAAFLLIFAFYVYYFEQHRKQNDQEEIILSQCQSMHLQAGRIVVRFDNLFIIGNDRKKLKQ